MSNATPAQARLRSLIGRCADVLDAKRTGVIGGRHLKSYARENYDGMMALWHAERDTVEEALTTVVGMRVPNAGNNAFGVDVGYFDEKLELILRDLNKFQPDELARVLVRLALTAKDDILNEKEFAELIKKAAPEADDKDQAEKVEPVGRFELAAMGNYPVLVWKSGYEARIGDRLYLQPGGVGVEQRFADVVAERLIESGAPNYIETGFTVDEHPELGQIVVTIRREGGKTPHELRMETEAKCEQLGARIKELKAEIAKHHSERAALNEWFEKTEWVQEEIGKTLLNPCHVGKHRADVMRVEIANLRQRIACLTSRLKPFADLLPHFRPAHARGRPSSGTICVWTTEGVGEHALTVEMLQDARDALEEGAKA